MKRANAPLIAGWAVEETWDDGEPVWSADNPHVDDVHSIAAWPNDAGGVTVDMTYDLHNTEIDLPREVAMAFARVLVRYVQQGPTPPPEPQTLHDLLRDAWTRGHLAPRDTPEGLDPLTDDEHELRERDVDELWRRGLEP